MKIDSYQVQASSQRSYLQIESSTSTTKWVSEAALEAANTEQEAAKLELSKEAAEQAKGQAGNSKADEDANAKALAEALKSYKPSSVQSSGSWATSQQDLKLKLLELMVYAMTGKRISAKPLEMNLKGNSLTQLGLSQLLGGGELSQAQPMRQVTEVKQFYYESESIQYQAQGVINTADGKSISVDISMSMSRQFVSYSSTSVVWEKPVDPIVINYAGTAASLTEQKYSFDLTMDGKSEQMSFVGPGSGFLAVDWNGDGKINDGGELFGPQSGDGFNELRAYDQDGNGWIDENDDIFSKLLVWSKDEDGNDQLFSLKELDIGAIYLGNVDTQFSLTDDANNTHGVMRTTSFFLKESGGAGTVSQIDLMI